jgi:hypothetical protein
MNLKKQHVWVIAGIIIIVGLTAGVMGFLFAKKTEIPAGQADALSASRSITNQHAVTQDTATDRSMLQPSVPSASSSASADKTAGWKIYTDTENEIEFKYPADWEVKPTAASDMGGTWLGITPRVVNEKNQYLEFYLAIFRSDIGAGATTGAKDDAETWYRNNLAGGPSTEQKRSERNGTSVFFSKDVYDASTNEMYVVSDNAGTVVYSYLTEKAYTYVNPKDQFVIGSKTSPKMELEYSNSEYVPIYEALIDSIVFTKK